MADEMEGCLGYLVAFMLIATAVIFAVVALVTIGSFFGAGTAIKNYYLAFRTNVQPEGAGA